MIADDSGDLDRLFHKLMQEIRPACLSFAYHGSEWRNKGMEGNREIGVVIDGRIKMCYLGFTYTLVSTVSFVFS